MMKHGPETRADDWPSCDIEAQRPATSRLSTCCGTMMRYGIWLKPRESLRREHEFHVAFDVRFDGPALHADRVGEVAAAQDVGIGQDVLATYPASFANADLRRDLDDVGLIESRRRFLDELEHVPALPAAFDLAVGQLACVDAADGRAVRVLDLGEVGAPFDRIALRADDRFLARKDAPALLGFLHELRHELPSAPGFDGIHTVDAEHRRRIEHVARAIARLRTERRPTRRDRRRPSRR